jgi:hypothetical protein
MGIAITGTDGRADSVPTNFTRGTAQTIAVYVLGNETPAWPSQGSGSFVLRIRLVPANATGIEPFHAVPSTSPLQLDAFGQYNETITVEPRATWTKSFSIRIAPAVTPCPKPRTGPTEPCYVLRFELLGLAGNVSIRSLASIVIT